MRQTYCEQSPFFRFWRLRRAAERARQSTPPERQSRRSRPAPSIQRWTINAAIVAPINCIADPRPRAAAAVGPAAVAAAAAVALQAAAVAAVALRAAVA